MGDIIINADDSEPEAELDNPVTVEAIDQLSSDAVAIAETNAAAEIAVEQIRADTAIELRQLEVDAQTERNDLAWHELEMTLQQVREELAAVTAERDSLLLLIPSPLSEPEPVAMETGELEAMPEPEPEATPEPESVPANNAPPKVRRVRFL